MKVFPWTVDENWICDRIVEEWNTFNSLESTKNIEEANVMWILSGWAWKYIHPDILSNKKIALTVHHIVPEKFNQDKLSDFKDRDRFIDLYHVPCKKTKIFIEKLTQKPIRVIPYWVNPKLWSFYDDKEDLKRRYKLPKDKVIIGSFQKDTEGSNLITPKLEKGPDIFCDIVESLKTKPHVILSGWRRQYVISRLEKANITYSYFEMADLKKLNELYNCLDFYLVTSRHEGGPQAILEATLTKTPILSTDVGIAEYVLNKKCILENKNQFCDFIENKKYSFLQENYDNCLELSVQNSVQKYSQMFKEIL